MTLKKTENESKLKLLPDYSKISEDKSKSPIPKQRIADKEYNALVNKWAKWAVKLIYNPNVDDNSAIVQVLMAERFLSATYSNTNPNFWERFCEERNKFENSSTPQFESNKNENQID